MSVYSTLTDQELTDLLMQGDQHAFATIHDRYYGVLYRHAFHRYPYREEIKDLLQDLFIYIWNNRESMQFTKGIASYLYTSTRNSLLNIYKHQKVELNYIQSFKDFIDQQEPIVDEMMREKELVLLIEKEVAKLPPQMRLVFEMSRNQNLSHKEIATKLSVSPLTVKKHVHKSLKILREKLGKMFYLLFF